MTTQKPGKCTNPKCDNAADFLHFSYTIAYDNDAATDDPSAGTLPRKQIDVWKCQKCRTLSRTETAIE